MFDWERFATPVVAAEAQSMRRFSVIESRSDELVDASTGRPFSYDSPCIERGTAAGLTASPTGATARLLSCT